MSLVDQEFAGFLPANSDFFIGIKLHYKKIAYFVLFVAFVTWAILLAIKPTYQSTVTLIVEPKSSNTINIDDVVQRADTREFFNSQIEIIKSRDNALKVIGDLRLWQTPEYKDLIPQKKSSGFLSFIPFLNTSSNSGKETKPSYEEALLPKFEGNLQVEPVRLTSLLKLKFESKDPKLAKEVVMAVARGYIFSDREMRLKMTKEASTWANDRLEGLRKRLLESERALQKYREDHGIVQLDGSVETIAAQQIGDVTQRLVEARVKRAEFQSAYHQIQKISNGDYSSVPYVIRSPIVLEAKSRENMAASKVAELKDRYGAEHPKMMAAESELRSAQETLKSQMALVVNSLKREYEVANSTVGALEGTLASARSSLTSVNRSGSDLGILMREVETNKQLYETFLSRAKETSEIDSFQAPVARIVESAADGVKIKPKKGLILLLVSLAATVLGLLAAVWHATLDNGVKGADDAEERLNYPVISSVPLVDDKRLPQALNGLNKGELDPVDALFVESIKTSATNLLLINADGTNKVVMVTSSVPGEGKTTVISMLAMVLSTTKKVLLVDCDFRRPKVANYFGLKTQSNGIVEAIVEGKPLEKCIVKAGQNNLYIVNSGKPVKNSLDLIHSKQFSDFIEKMKSEFDYILIDSPPVELVSDALATNVLVDKTIFVVKSYETDIRLVRKSLSRLSSVKNNIMGIVINKVDYAKSNSLYGEYSAYTDYGYHDE